MTDPTFDARDRTEADAVASIATKAAEPEELARGALVTIGGTIYDLRQYDDEPDRIRAGRRFNNTDSLGRYVAANDEGRASVYVDADRLVVVAVLDDHRVHDGEQAPSRATHTAELGWKHSLEWEAWLAQDGNMTTQTTFAEFLEDRVGDVTTPSGAELLELVTTIRASERGEFTGSTKSRSGSYELSYKLDVDLGAGPGGTVELPETIVIAIPVFDHQMVAHEIAARLRYRLNGGKLSLQYHLERPDLVHREAIATEVAALQVLVGDGVPVYQGRP